MSSFRVHPRLYSQIIQFWSCIYNFLKCLSGICEGMNRYKGKQAASKQGKAAQYVSSHRSASSLSAAIIG
jgi:hypothetical protein